MDQVNINITPQTQHENRNSIWKKNLTNNITPNMLNITNRASKSNIPLNSCAFQCVLDIL